MSGNETKMPRSPDDDKALAMVASGEALDEIGDRRHCGRRSASSGGLHPEPDHDYRPRVLAAIAGAALNDWMRVPRLAAVLHAGQVDKAGQPYIDHLRRVTEILGRRWPDATQDDIDAAWLHDAIEDTSATGADLLAAGVSARTVEIVEALTRPEGPAYLEWIEAIARAGDQSVIRVKLADNEDNRDPARVAALPGAAERVAKRYEPARRILEAALSPAKTRP